MATKTLKAMWLRKEAPTEADYEQAAKDGATIHIDARERAKALLKAAKNKKTFLKVLRELILIIEKEGINLIYGFDWNDRMRWHADQSYATGEHIGAQIIWYSPTGKKLLVPDPLANADRRKEFLVLDRIMRLQYDVFSEAERTNALLNIKDAYPLLRRLGCREPGIGPKTIRAYLLEHGLRVHTTETVLPLFVQEKERA